MMNVARVEHEEKEDGRLELSEFENLRIWEATHVKSEGRPDVPGPPHNPRFVNSTPFRRLKGVLSRPFLEIVPFLCAKRRQTPQPCPPGGGG